MVFVLEVSVFLVDVGEWTGGPGPDREGRVEVPDMRDPDLESP